MNNKNQVIAERYKVVCVITKGQNSSIYRAFDSERKEYVAVKKIKRTDSEKWDFLIKLKHPALPEVTDVIEKEEYVYIVMNYIYGIPLDRIIYKFGAQSEDIVSQWMKELGSALDYLHRCKPVILHRDIKPANIMLQPEGNIKLIDFGSAAEYEDEKDGITAILGTKGYAAPEQYVGYADERSDIYGLGMTMYSLLTGELLQKGKCYIPISQLNYSISKGTEFIIEKCVQPDACMRYQNCQELLYDLYYPERAGTTHREKQKRDLLKFTVLVLATFIFFAGGVIFMYEAKVMGRTMYDALCCAVNSPESYEKAIKIFPDKTDAYLKLLEYYEITGVFGRIESERFLALYNGNKSVLSSDNNDVAYLNYKAGTMYLNFYSEKNSGEAMAERIQKAYPFFQENHKNSEKRRNFKEEELSEGYFSICSFYTKYILKNSTMLEISSEEFDDLFTKIRNIMEKSDKEGSYERLILCSTVMDLIYDQRILLADVGYDKNSILNLMNQIYIKVTEIKPIKRPLIILQKSVIKNFDPYCVALERAYSNCRKERNS